MRHNIGEIDANARKFLAVPAAALVATSTIAYEAYAFAAFVAIAGLYSLISGILRFSALYALAHVSTVGGLHRVPASRARPAPRGA